MAGAKWTNGNVYASFVELMALSAVDAQTFQSTFPAYSPGNLTRAYGGHVFAQAALAAARTVEQGFVVHSITGWFTIQGLTTKPFIYRVRTIREGRSYCQRRVDVWQDAAQHAICFTCVVSFKKPERSFNERQHHVDLREKYRDVLGDKRPEEFPECPTVDSPYFWAAERKTGRIPFPGLTMTKVDMSAYNEGRSTLDRRQLHWYKVIGKLPSVQEDPNLHAAAHLYASDRNGLFPVPNFLDVGDDYSAMASLSHTVIFHSEAEELRMIDADGRERWFLEELAVDRIAHGRALVTSRCWRENGLHIFTHFQDGQIRMDRREPRKTSKEIFGGNVPQPQPQPQPAKGKL